VSLSHIAAGGPHVATHNEERDAINNVQTQADGLLSRAGGTSILDPFWKKIAARDLARVNVLMIGASLVEGFPVSSHDLGIAQRLAQMLRDKYPTAGAAGSRGLVSIPSQGVSPAIASPLTISGGAVDPSVYSADAAFNVGFNKNCWYTNGTGSITHTAGPKVTSVDIVYMKSNAGGTTAGTWSKNGGAGNVFSTYDASVASVNKINVAAVEGDTVQVVCGGGGYIIVLGFIEYGGTELKGIAIHGAGHSGYKTNQWAATSDPGGWRDALSFINPDLLIISDLGVNDGSNGRSNTQYATDIQNLITVLRAGLTPLPTVPIVLVSVYDPSGAVTLTTPDWRKYVTANRDTARSNSNVLHFDLSPIIPSTAWSTTAKRDLFYSDGLHSNVNGSLYAEIARHIFNAITP
jgi:lysophospholipase L1-like esterase